MEEVKLDLRFKEFIGNAKVAEYRRIREEIIKKSRCTRQVFARWEKGLNTPQLYNQVVINTVARSYGYPDVYDGVGIVTQGADML